MGEDYASKTRWLHCCLFLGRGSAIVYSLFIVAPIGCVDFVYGPFFVYAVLCVLSSFANIPLGKTELVTLIFYCILNVMSLLSFFITCSWCHVFVCSV